MVAVSACALAPTSTGAQSASGGSGGSGAYGGTQFYEQPVIKALQCRKACGATATPPAIERLRLWAIG